LNSVALNPDAGRGRKEIVSQKQRKNRAIRGLSEAGRGWSAVRAAGWSGFGRANNASNNHVKKYPIKSSG
jgi:hypothetical protein